MSNPVIPEDIDGRFMGKVVNRARCGRHDAPIGDPCWWLETSYGKILGAVCDKRSRAAGFVGRPSDKSLKITKGPRRP